MFIKIKKEREVFKSFFKGDLSMNELLHENITSDNGIMVRDLISRIQTDDGEIPEEYKEFIKDITKTSPVVGYLQATHQESLNILNDFCDKRLDLRSPERGEQIKQMKKEFPTLWCSLMDILSLEKNHRYLPDDVTKILKTLITIRMETFSKSVIRKDHQYFEYPENGKESSTQFYPNYEILKYPSEYQIKSEGGQGCEKKFKKPAKFAPGLFHIGCSCPRNVTLGFEVMLEPESSHNLGRLLMCRDIDMDKGNLQKKQKKIDKRQTWGGGRGVWSRSMSKKTSTAKFL